MRRDEDEIISLKGLRHTLPTLGWQQNLLLGAYLKQNPSKMRGRPSGDHQIITRSSSSSSDNHQISTRMHQITIRQSPEYRQLITRLLPYHHQAENRPPKLPKIRKKASDFPRKKARKILENRYSDIDFLVLGGQRQYWCETCHKMLAQTRLLFLSGELATIRAFHWQRNCFAGALHVSYRNEL